jgi:hypothetical protein
MLANCFTSMHCVSLLTAALGPSLAVATPEQPRTEDKSPLAGIASTNKGNVICPRNATVGQRALWPETSGGFRIGGNAPLLFSSIDTAYQASPILCSLGTGLSLGQGDQHDGAETDQGIPYCSTGAKT